MSNGIPANSWVRDLEIAANGAIVAATTNGVFFSTNNGDSWFMASGVTSSDTVSTLVILSDTTSDGGKTGLQQQVVAGTVGGKIIKGILEETTLTFETTYLFTGDAEIAGIIAVYELQEQAYYLFAALYDAYGAVGGVIFSLLLGGAWEYIDDNLPDVVSAIASTYPSRNNSAQRETYTLFAGVFNNTTNGAGVYKLSFTVDVEEIDNQIPSDNKLAQNYPNPFNPSTTIQFALPKESFTRLEIYNALGEKVLTLVSENLKAGTYEYEWNAEGLPSGIYFYRLNTENYSEIKKMILLR
jgi:hypothetical protein